MRPVIDTEKIKEFFFGKKYNRGKDLPVSQYGEFPPVPENIELIGLREKFKELGEMIIKKFEFDGLITPSSKILDIGCGNGSVAMPMTKYLNKEGRYFGMDISKERIDWLKENVTNKYPHVRFVYNDIYNKMYNTEGKVKASEYGFPFKDESFDFIFLYSVFTHMLPKDVENYMKEIHRILKKGGKCSISYFLINPYTIELIEKGRCHRKFVKDEGVYMTNSIKRHESMMDYKENYIYNLYKVSGFRGNISTRYGEWRELNYGGKGASQDIIIAEK